MVCIDGTDGRPLWLHQVVPHTRVAIDPRDDALWTWERDEGSSILRIDAETGTETVRGRMPRHAAVIDAVRGLKIAGLRLWSAPTANETNVDKDDELDVDSGEVHREATHPALFSPSQIWALREVDFQSPEELSTAITLVRPPWPTGACLCGRSDSEDTALTNLSGSATMRSFSREPQTPTAPSPA